MKKIAQSTCTVCHYIMPRTEMQQRVEVENAGYGLGISGNLNNKRSNPRGGIRTYYRKKKVWICNDCCKVIDRKDRMGILFWILVILFIFIGIPAISNG